MIPLNFLSNNFLVISIFTISLFSGINILVHCNELMATSNLNNNENEKLMRGIALLHFLVLCTIGDVTLIKKARKNIKEMKKKKNQNIKKVTLLFLGLYFFAIFYFTLIYFTTKNSLHEFDKFQLTILGLIVLNIIWLLLSQRYFWKISKVYDHNKFKKFRKLNLMTINWLSINFCFLVFSGIILIYNDYLSSITSIDLKQLWLYLFWLRSITDMIICRHFYAKVVMRLLNKKGVKLNTPDS